MEDRTKLINKNRDELLRQLDSVKKDKLWEPLGILIGMIVSMLFAVLGGILQENEWDFIGLIITIIGAGGIGLCLWGFFVAYLFGDRKDFNKKINSIKSKLDNVEQLTDKQIEQNKEKERIKEEREQKELKLKAHEDELIKEHGEPIKSVILYKGYDNSRFNNKVCVFSDDTISIGGQFYNFSEILGVDCTDDVHTVQTSMTTSTGESKTNNGNMALRTGVGYVVGGAAGAIIGGSTAKRGISSTGTTTTTSETKHNYEIVITLDNFEKPQIVLRFRKNRSAFQEVKSILTIILNKNKISK